MKMHPQKTTARQSVFRLAKPIMTLAALILCFSINQARSQNYAISWSKIAGGGGTSTNGPYSLSGTIGQHDASGPMTGGNFSLTGGFWALYAVQTPGAPTLRIFLTSSNTAVVAYPYPADGYILQVNTNLATSNWSAAGGTANVVGSENQVIIYAPTGNRFYRLVHL